MKHDTTAACQQGKVEQVYIKNTTAACQQGKVEQVYIKNNVSNNHQSTTKKNLQIYVKFKSFINVL